MQDHSAEWVGGVVLVPLLVFGCIACLCVDPIMSQHHCYSPRCVSSKVHTWRLDLTGLVAIIKTNNLGRYYNGDKPILQWFIVLSQLSLNCMLFWFFVCLI